MAVAAVASALVGDAADVLGGKINISRYAGLVYYRQYLPCIGEAVQRASSPESPTGVGRLQ
jgi:hypothetical protein